MLPPATPDGTFPESQMLRVKITQILVPFNFCYAYQRRATITLTAWLDPHYTPQYLMHRYIK